jgi:DNA-binding response OmpR family regulator
MLEAGMDDYISMPFKPQELLDDLDDVEKWAQRSRRGR